MYFVGQDADRIHFAAIHGPFAAGYAFAYLVAAGYLALLVVNVVYRIAYDLLAVFGLAAGHRSLFVSEHLTQYQYLFTLLVFFVAAEGQIGMAARKDAVAELVQTDGIAFLNRMRIRYHARMVALAGFKRGVNGNRGIGIGIVEFRYRRVAMRKREAIQQVPLGRGQPLERVGRQCERNATEVAHHGIGHTEYAHLNDNLGGASAGGLQHQHVLLGRIGHLDGQNAVRHVVNRAVGIHPRIEVVGRTRPYHIHLHLFARTLGRIGYVERIGLEAVVNVNGVAVRAAVGGLHVKIVGVRFGNRLYKRAVGADFVGGRIGPLDERERLVRFKEGHFHIRGFAEVRIPEAEQRFDGVFHHNRHRIVLVAGVQGTRNVQRNIGGGLRRRYGNGAFSGRYLHVAAVGLYLIPSERIFRRIGKACGLQQNRRATANRIEFRIGNLGIGVEGKVNRLSPFATGLGYGHQRIVIDVGGIEFGARAEDGRIRYHDAVLQPVVGGRFLAELLFERYAKRIVAGAGGPCRRQTQLEFAQGNDHRVVENAVRASARTFRIQVGHTYAERHRFRTIVKRGVDLVSVVDGGRYVFVGPFHNAVVTDGVFRQIEFNPVAYTRLQRIGQDGHRQRIHIHMDGVAVGTAGGVMLDGQIVSVRIVMAHLTVGVGGQRCVGKAVEPCHRITPYNGVQVTRREQTDKFVLTNERVAHRRNVRHDEELDRGVGRVEATALLVLEFEADVEDAVVRRARIAQRVGGGRIDIGGRRRAHGPDVVVVGMARRRAGEYHIGGTEVGGYDGHIRGLGLRIDMDAGGVGNHATARADGTYYIHRVTQGRIGVGTGGRRAGVARVEQPYLRGFLRADVGADLYGGAVAYRGVGRVDFKRELVNHHHHGVGCGAAQAVAVKTGHVIGGVGRGTAQYLGLVGILTVGARGNEALAYFLPFVRGHKDGRVVEADLRQTVVGARTDNRIGAGRNRGTVADNDLYHGVGAATGQTVGYRQRNAVAFRRRKACGGRRIAGGPLVLVAAGLEVGSLDRERGRIVGAHGHGGRTARIGQTDKVGRYRHRQYVEFYRVVELTAVGGLYRQIIVVFVKFVGGQAVVGVVAFVELTLRSAFHTVGHGNAAHKVGHLQRIVEAVVATAYQGVAQRRVGKDVAQQYLELEAVGNAATVVVDRGQVQHRVAHGTVERTGRINRMQARSVAERTVSARSPLRTAAIDRIAAQLIGFAQHHFAVGTGFHTYAVQLARHLVRYGIALGRVRAEAVVEHAHHKAVLLGYRTVNRRIVAQDRIAEQLVVLVAQYHVVHIPRIGIGHRCVVVARAGLDFDILRAVFELTDFVKRGGVYPGVDFVNRVNLYRYRVRYQRILRVGAIVVGDDLGIDVVVGVEVVGGLQVLERYRVAEVVHRHVAAVEIPVDARVVAAVLYLGQGLDAVHLADVVTCGIVVERTVFRMDADKAYLYPRIGQLDGLDGQDGRHHGRVLGERPHHRVAVKDGVNLVAGYKVILRNRIAAADKVTVAVPFDVPAVRTVVEYGTRMGRGRKEADGRTLADVDRIVLDARVGVDVDGRVNRLEHHHRVDNRVAAHVAHAEVFKYNAYAIRAFRLEEVGHVFGIVDKALFGLNRKVDAVAVPSVADAVAYDVGADGKARVFVIDGRIGDVDARKADGTGVTYLDAQRVVVRIEATVDVAVADRKHRIALNDERTDAVGGFTRGPLQGQAFRLAEHAVGIAVLRADVVVFFFQTERIGQGMGLDGNGYRGVAIVGMRNQNAVGLRFAGQNVNRAHGTGYTVFPSIYRLDVGRIGVGNGLQHNGRIGAGYGVGRNLNTRIAFVGNLQRIGNGGLFFRQNATLGGGYDAPEAVARHHIGNADGVGRTHLGDDAVGHVALIPRVGGVAAQVSIGVNHLDAEVVVAAEAVVAQGDTERGMTVAYGRQHDGIRRVGAEPFGTVGDAADVERIGQSRDAERGALNRSHGFVARRNGRIGRRFGIGYRELGPRAFRRAAIEVSVSQVIEVARGGGARHLNRFLFANRRVARNRIGLNTVDVNRNRVGHRADGAVVAGRDGVYAHIEAYAVLALGGSGRQVGYRVGAGSKLRAVNKPRISRVEVEARIDAGADRRRFLFANRIGGHVQDGGHVVALANDEYVREYGVGTVAMAIAVVGVNHQTDAVAVGGRHRVQGVGGFAVHRLVIDVPLVTRLRTRIDGNVHGGAERVSGARLLRHNDACFRFAVAFHFHKYGVGAERSAGSRLYVTDKPGVLGQGLGIEQRVERGCFFFGGDGSGLGGLRRGGGCIGTGAGGGHIRGGRNGLGTGQRRKFGVEVGAAVVRKRIGAVAARGNRTVDIYVMAFADERVGGAERQAHDTDMVVADGGLVVYASRVTVEDAAVERADTDNRIVTAVGHISGQLLVGTGHLLSQAGVGGVERTVHAVEQVPSSQTGRIAYNQFGQRTGADGVMRRVEVQLAENRHADGIGRIGALARTVEYHTTVVLRGFEDARRVVLDTIDEYTLCVRHLIGVLAVGVPAVTVGREVAVGQRAVQRVGQRAHLNHLLGRDEVTAQLAERRQRERVAAVETARFVVATGRIIVNRSQYKGIGGQTDGNRIGYATHIRRISLRVGGVRIGRAVNHRRQRQRQRAVEGKALIHIRLEVEVGGVAEARLKVGGLEAVAVGKRIAIQDVDKRKYRLALAVGHFLTYIELMQAHTQVERVEVERLALEEYRLAAVVVVPAYLGLRRRGLDAERRQGFAEAIGAVGRGRQTRQAVFMNRDVNRHVAVAVALSIHIADGHVVVAIGHRREYRRALERIAAVDTEFEQAPVFVHADFDGRRIDGAHQQAVSVLLFHRKGGRHGQEVNRQRVGKGRMVEQTLGMVGFEECIVAVAFQSVVNRAGLAAQTEVGKLGLADAEPTEAGVRRPRVAVRIGLNLEVYRRTFAELALGGLNQTRRELLQFGRHNFDRVGQ